MYRPLLKIPKPHICVVQAFKVGDEKRKNGLEYKCVSRKCPHFELSDIIMLAAPQKTSLFQNK